MLRNTELIGDIKRGASQYLVILFFYGEI